MPNRGLVIAIDGPAGAGKTTLARGLAHELGAALLDTGAIYRGLAWLADTRNVSWTDEVALAELCDALAIRFAPPSTQPADAGRGRQRVFVGEQEVTTAIRTPHISEGASQVSAHPAVRGRLLGLQRAIAAKAVEEGRGCVAEGRDMGSVVFPDADHKFFLTADSQVRAGRRHQELEVRGQNTMSVQEISAEMRRRDERDSTRETAPLVQAEDAVLIESTALDSNTVLHRVLGLIRGETTP